MTHTAKGIAYYTSTAQELRNKFPELLNARETTLLLMFDTAMHTFIQNVRSTLWSMEAAHFCTTEGENNRKIIKYRVEGGWGAAEIEITYANIDPGKGEMWLMAEKAVFTGDTRGTCKLFEAFNGICRNANFSGLRRVIED